MARRLCRAGAAGADLVGILLDEVEGRARRPGPRSRSERTGYRSGLLFAQQPLQARFVAVTQGSSGQQIFVDRDRGSRGPAAAVHLRAALTDAVRDRGNSTLGLAVARSRRAGLLPCR